MFRGIKIVYVSSSDADLIGFAGFLDVETEIVNPGSLRNTGFSNNCRTVFFDCCIFYILFSRLDLVQKYHL